MHIGGVLLGAGMVLDLKPGDYLNGHVRLRYLIRTIVGLDGVWIILDGFERPTASHGWLDRRVRVRQDALKRSLSLA